MSVAAADFPSRYARLPVAKFYRAAYPWDFIGTIRAQPSTANASWKACAYGNTACPNGGNVYISDFASPEKRLGTDVIPLTICSFF